MAISGKWDYYKVAKGTSLSQSRRSAGAYRGLIHGTKGVKKQAEFFKVERRDTVLSTLATFVAKVLIAMFAIGIVVAIAVVLLGAVVSGISAGLADAAASLSTASGYLAAGAVVLAVLAWLPLKVARALRRSQARSVRRDFIDQRRVADNSWATHAGRSWEANTAQGHQSTWAQQPVPASATLFTPAGWHIDPSNPSQFRYWNGARWTTQIAPRLDAPLSPAGWYPSSGHVSRLQYWDGQSWTAHFRPAPDRVEPRVPSTAPPPHRQHSTDNNTARTSMTSAEWQSYVRAWIASGAIEQELWRRLSNARISDADPNIIEVQRQMGRLTAQQGAERIRFMIEADPRSRSELSRPSLFEALLQGLAPLDRRSRVRIEDNREKKLPY